jgi:hypothetical protein
MKIILGIILIFFHDSAFMGANTQAGEGATMFVSMTLRRLCTRSLKLRGQQLVDNRLLSDVCPCINCPSNCEGCHKGQK